MKFYIDSALILGVIFNAAPLRADYVINLVWQPTSYDKTRQSIILDSDKSGSFPLPDRVKLWAIKNPEAKVLVWYDGAKDHITKAQAAASQADARDFNENELGLNEMTMARQGLAYRDFRPLVEVTSQMTAYFNSMTGDIRDKILKIQVLLDGMNTYCSDQQKTSVEPEEDQQIAPPQRKANCFSLFVDWDVMPLDKDDLFTKARQQELQNPQRGLVIEKPAKLPFNDNSYYILSTASETTINSIGKTFEIAIPVQVKEPEEQQ